MGVQTEPCFNLYTCSIKMRAIQDNSIGNKGLADVSANFYVGWMWVRKEWKLFYWTFITVRWRWQHLYGKRLGLWKCIWRTKSFSSISRRLHEVWCWREAICGNAIFVELRKNRKLSRQRLPTFWPQSDENFKIFTRSQRDETNQSFITILVVRWRRVWALRKRRWHKMDLK